MVGDIGRRCANPEAAVCDTGVLHLIDEPWAKPTNGVTNVALWTKEHPDKYQPRYTTGTGVTFWCVWVVNSLRQNKKWVGTRYWWNFCMCLVRVKKHGKNGLNQIKYVHAPKNEWVQKILWGWKIFFVQRFFVFRSKQVNGSGKLNNNHIDYHFFWSIWHLSNKYMIPLVHMGLFDSICYWDRRFIWIDQLNADISELNINIFAQQLWWLCLALRFGICGCQDAQSAGDWCERPMIVLAQSFISCFQSVLRLN